MFIPFMQTELDDDPKVYTLQEYAIDFETGKLTGGIVEGKDALKVWIHKALKTNRYVYTIYSWDYGNELETLIGNNYEKGFIISEVERMVSDCLTVHPNIKRCYGFDVSLNNDHLTTTFTVDTDFGEVVINV